MVGSVKVPYKKTILRRDRRQPDRYDVRGRISDRTIKVGIATDTSGSVSDEELAWVFDEVFGILKCTKFKLTIMECDAAIQRVYTADKRTQIQTKVKGRGGTYFQPVFDYIAEENLDLDILVFFTDGGGENSLKFKPKHKTMWVLTGGKKDLSIKEPYGKVKELNFRKGKK
jgi:predicted metal-dependent peptidase